MSSIVTAVTWIPRGVAKATPLKYDPAEDEITAFRREADVDTTKEIPEAAYEELREDDDDDGEDDTQAMNDDDDEEGDAKGKGSSDDPLKDFDMEHYDDEDDYAFLGTTIKEYSKAVVDGDDEQDLEELEDIMIKPTDALLIAASSEEDFSHLDVYLYEEDCDNLYVHHDIILGSFPLCVEWLDYTKGAAEEKGNYVAVGTFLPEIEIWNLDIIDVMQPAVVLGGHVKSASGKRSKKLVADSHQDSVLCLSWNRSHRNILASGSADHTVKLWDIEKGACVHTLTHHTDKAQAVQWNPVETSVLLSGSFDKTVKALDVRTPDRVATWKLTADVETVAWNPHMPNCFIATTEDGIATYHDALKPGSTMFTLSAHSKPVSALCFNPAVPGLIVTGSTDKTIKFWNISDGKPKCVHSLTSELGKIFTLSFFKDSPHLLAVGGENNEIKVMNTLNLNQELANVYAAAANVSKSTSTK